MTTLVIKFKALVLSIEERFKKRYIPDSGMGDKAQFDNISQGFFVVLDGSREALHIGESNPGIRVGSVAKIEISFDLGQKTGQ